MRSKRPNHAVSALAIAKRGPVSLITNLLRRYWSLASPYSQRCSSPCCVRQYRRHTGAPPHRSATGSRGGKTVLMHLALGQNTRSASTSLGRTLTDRHRQSWQGACMWCRYPDGVPEPVRL